MGDLHVSLSYLKIGQGHPSEMIYTNFVVLLIVFDASCQVKKS